MCRVREERRASADLEAAEETVVKRASQGIKELQGSPCVPPDSTCTTLGRWFLISLVCNLLYVPGGARTSGRTRQKRSERRNRTERKCRRRTRKALTLGLETSFGCNNVISFSAGRSWT